MRPLKYDPDGIPCFCSFDIDDYGRPELYGYKSYRVIESRDLNIVVDFKYSSACDLRPIHRYDRLLRFKNTLLNLIGERGKVPNHVLSMVKSFMKKDSKDPWNACRKILKHFKQRKYYDNIPYILKHLKLFDTFKIGNDFCLEDILNIFKRFVVEFEKKKGEYKRVYFPNMRYIALKLLKSFGIESSYKIPFARTARKNVLLDKIWDDLFKF
jgi:hypothetical protein